MTPHKLPKALREKVENKLAHWCLGNRDIAMVGAQFTYSEVMEQVQPLIDALNSAFVLLCADNCSRSDKHTAGCISRQEKIDTWYEWTKQESGE